MSRHNTTETEEIALLGHCDTCGAKPGYWCTTRRGAPTYYLHTPRTYAWYQGYWSGQTDAHDDQIAHIRGMTPEQVLAYHERLLAGKKW